MNCKHSKISKSWIFWLLCLVLLSCNTGIESTKTIKMTREDRRMSVMTPEETLAATIVSQPLSEWNAGKRFLVADNKASLVLTSENDRMSAASDSLAGKTFVYDGVISKLTPGGEFVNIIRLKGEDDIFHYNTGKVALTDSLFTGLDLPMLIDMDLVALADSKLRGRQVWTNSRLWYDESMTKFNGRRFAKVTIKQVRPGNMYFPLIVDFADANGHVSSMYMNVADPSRSSGNDSRAFQNLFLLEDPKLKYPSITAENWELICTGNVAKGMTKEECRLSLGNPTDVNAGHNWDSLLDVWGYSDGTYLQFQDGLLVNFRH